MGHEARENSLKEWGFLLNSIFQDRIPENRSWSEKKDIIKVLQLLGSRPNINLTFSPDGGRLELKGAAECAEQDCIALHFVEEPAYIVKPKDLIFQSFNELYEWAYFRLETKGLEPSGWYEKLTGKREELTELHPGEYIHRSYWDAGCYEFDETGRELPLPGTARIVFRYLSGSFIFFAQASPYIEKSSTDDGLRSNMTEEEFKKYIGSQLRLLKEEGQI